MGFRTVVVLFNDQASDWMNDPELGKKISMASNGFGHRNDGDIHYGRVVECCHADQITLGMFDSYNFKPMGYGMWSRDETDEETQLRMLKEAADKLGYRLTKKAK